MIEWQGEKGKKERGKEGGKKKRKEEGKKVESSYIFRQDRKKKEKRQFVFQATNNPISRGKGRSGKGKPD